MPNPKRQQQIQASRLTSGQFRGWKGEERDNNKKADAKRGQQQQQQGFKSHVKQQSTA